MAFFGLTYKGYQKKIRECVNNPEPRPWEYGERLKLQDHLLQRENTQFGEIKLSPRQPSPKPKMASICPIDQVSGYGPGPQGSYVEYTRINKKHIRNPDGPVHIYRYPVTTSQQVGRFEKDGAGLKLRDTEKWVHVPRHTHVNSEMTRFVNEMNLTNREFSLF